MHTAHHRVKRSPKHDAALRRCCPVRVNCQARRNRAEILNRNHKVAGAPEEIRTPDPQIRSLVLYPAELRARFSRAFQGARPGHPACIRKTFSEVAKARHSYRLRAGLARSDPGHRNSIQAETAAAIREMPR